MVSKKPGKQRLRLYTLPLHRRHVLLSATLSPELRKKYGRRSLPVRKGDRVRIMRGDFKKLEGEVLKVDRKKVAVIVEGATVRKADGTEVPRKIHPSNLMIVKLAQDKKREKALSRSGSQKASTKR
ncbi:MAG: 50S ribosomal protein L24 [Candidatus Hadarchaeales archaeon]